MGYEPLSEDEQINADQDIDAMERRLANEDTFIDTCVRCGHTGYYEGNRWRHRPDQFYCDECWDDEVAEAEANSR